MSGPVTIEMPFPPSANNMFAGVGRRYQTPGYKRWRRQAELTVMAARAPKFTGPVNFKITLHPRDNRRRDADNYVKPLVDCAVRMQVIEDDNHQHMKEVTVCWGEQRVPPTAVVTITPLS